MTRILPANRERIVLEIDSKTKAILHKYATKMDVSMGHVVRGLIDSWKESYLSARVKHGKTADIKQLAKLEDIS